jgi:hypothetical protein
MTPAGLTTINGHPHLQRCDTGCLADPEAPSFVDYTEDSPKNWRSGFGVFTFVRGRLLRPKVVAVADRRHVDFRGKLIAV